MDHWDDRSSLLGQDVSPQRDLPTIEPWTMQPHTAGPQIASSRLSERPLPSRDASVHSTFFSQFTTLRTSFWVSYPDRQLLALK